MKYLIQGKIDELIESHEAASNYGAPFEIDGTTYVARMSLRDQVKLIGLQVAIAPMPAEFSLGYTFYTQDDVRVVHVLTKLQIQELYGAAFTYMLTIEQKLATLIEAAKLAASESELNLINW